MELRPAAAGDVRFLRSLRRGTMRRHFQAAGIGWNEAKQRERVQYKLGCAQIVVHRGSDAGLIKVDRGSDPWTLVQIQLLPRLQGQGIGRRLITAVLEEASERQAQVSLTVLKASPARRLYRRLGFRPVGERERSLDMLWTPGLARRRT